MLTEPKTRICPQCGISHDACREMLRDALEHPEHSENIDALEIITANCKTCRKELKGEAVEKISIY